MIGESTHGALPARCFAALPPMKPAQTHQHCQVRDAIKAGMLQPALLAGEEDEAQDFFTLLAVTTARHNRALAPLWARAPPLADGGGGEAGAALHKAAAAVAAAGVAGDARFRAYVGFLLGLINYAAKVRMSSVLAFPGMRAPASRWQWRCGHRGSSGARLAPPELPLTLLVQAFLESTLAASTAADRDSPATRGLEQQLCRLEDAALVLLLVREPGGASAAVQGPHGHPRVLHGPTSCCMAQRAAARRARARSHARNANRCRAMRGAGGAVPAGRALQGHGRRAAAALPPVGPHRRGHAAPGSVPAHARARASRGCRAAAVGVAAVFGKVSAAAGGGGGCDCGSPGCCGLCASRGRL